ncbi:hypothetical protein SR187_2020 [Streptococcus ruminantium]|uniref:Uncharacterized protein n=1 Tax=Streptococcus ruminantium TaxID=1917441 RepID=A0A2Z5TKX4_9STRE|nr:hypothetical protein SR187_2020 [Streptococcus ruminantium]
MSSILSITIVTNFSKKASIQSWKKAEKNFYFSTVKIRLAYLP